MDDSLKYWLAETQADESGHSNVRVSLRVKNLLFEKQSQFQKIKVFDTTGFGRVLQLDDVIQTTGRDEFVYHEMISHVPLLTHPNPKQHLVIGGGDGGASREALKHSLRESWLVDIDEDVIKTAQEYLPELSCEFANPRLNIQCVDGLQFVKDHKSEFDVISIDSTDPVGHAVGLFSEEFYVDVYQALKADGLMVCQSESPFYYPGFIRDLHKRLKNIFPIVRLYTAVVPTYPGAYWSWTLASKKYDPLEISIAEIEERLKLRKIENLRWFSPEIYKSAFVLPPFVKSLFH